MLDWKDLTIARALKEASERWGESQALASKDQRFTYGDLYRRSCQLASGLRKLGIKKGDHVATLFGIVPEWVITKYALHILGAVIVPLNVNFRSEELKYVLNQADVKTLITYDELRFGNYLDLLGEIDPKIASGPDRAIQSEVLPHLEDIVCLSPGRNKYPYCHDFDEVMASGADYKDEEIERLLETSQPSDVCNILFTSGSTAFPKGAVHIHTSLLGIGEHLFGQTYRLDPSHKLLCYLPFYHIAGCVYNPLGALIRGCSLYLNDFIPDEILPIIQDERISLFGGFDGHFNAIQDHPRRREYDLSSIRFILLATGPEWYDKCKTLFPGAEIIAHHYGFTEGTGVSVMPDEQDYKVRKYTNGRQWPGIEIKVVDPDTGERVAPKQGGELCLRGWSRLQEYYKNPEETRKAIDPEGFFHSGDYGWLDEEGNVVYRGRYKMMVKTGGENVSQREVEIFLESMVGVKAVQVIGVPDERWGEAVTAVIEPETGMEISQDDVRDFSRDRIARFKIPKHVLSIRSQDWPLLGAGKVDKIRLKQWAMERLNLK